jgi:hypothetical protein
LPPSLLQRSLLLYRYWLSMEGPVERVPERDTVTVGRVILTLETPHQRSPRQRS